MGDPGGCLRDFQQQARRYILAMTSMLAFILSAEPSLSLLMAADKSEVVLLICR